MRKRGDTEHFGLRTSVGVPMTPKDTCVEVLALALYAISAFKLCKKAWPTSMNYNLEGT